MYEDKQMFLKSGFALLEKAAAAVKSLQSCPTLCDPIDGSPPDSAVPGILQARTLEWVAISFSIWRKQEVTKQEVTVVTLCSGHGRILLQAQLLPLGSAGLQCCSVCVSWSTHGTRLFRGRAVT